MAELFDQPSRKDRLDPQDMIGLVETFPAQCQEGERIARQTQLPTLSGIRHVVICGMGGSAIGGDLLRAYASTQATVSIEVVRNYGLPHYAGPETLVIASSYSGNTEETLSAYDQAKKRGSAILGITTGGTLADRCRRDGYPLIQVPGGMPPRAALGYSFMPLLVSLERLDLLPDQKKEIQGLHKILKQSSLDYAFAVPTQTNPAKQLAKQLDKTVPIIYSGQDAFQPVATRWRCQFNENAKVFAHDMVVPEMNHNEILGWGNPKPVLKKFHALFLLDKGYHKQTQKRFTVMHSIIEPAAHGLTCVESKGSGLLARLFSLIHFGDFVSVYLAYLCKEDPTPIPAIDLLKQEMAKK
ncbi:MAG: bifunctional phosphoglucose/phosphomannose isomerase [bacterium]|jgi:glucose/mannose-6-phosphate isomerase|nr:bifunctional phosphoglucose/phosphomannose isomerase [bacterium]